MKAMIIKLVPTLLFVTLTVPAALGELSLCRGTWTNQPCDQKSGPTIREIESAKVNVVKISPEAPLTAGASAGILVEPSPTRVPLHQKNIVITRYRRLYLDAQREFSREVIPRREVAKAVNNCLVATATLQECERLETSLEKLVVTARKEELERQEQARREQNLNVQRALDRNALIEAGRQAGRGDLNIYRHTENNVNIIVPY